MTFDRAIRLCFICLIVIAALAAFIPGAFASGDELTAEAAAEASATSGATGGTASSGSNRALSLGGGDIDIADGYRSYSYLFGLVQDTKSNPLEVARQLIAEGNYEAAAYLRCRPWGIYRAYGGRDKCIAILSKPPTWATEAEGEDVEVVRGQVQEHVEDHAALDRQQAEEIAMLRQQNVAIQQELEQQRQARRRPRPAPVVVQHRPFLDEAGVSAILALRKPKDDDEDDDDE